MTWTASSAAAALKHGQAPAGREAHGQQDKQQVRLPDVKDGGTSGQQQLLNIQCQHGLLLMSSCHEPTRGAAAAHFSYQLPGSCQVALRCLIKSFLVVYVLTALILQAGVTKPSSTHTFLATAAAATAT